MSIRADKPRESKDHMPGDRFVQRRQNIGRGFQFVDNRPEALQLKRLQETINKQPSSSVLQLKAGVESFQVQWKKHPEAGGKNAAHQIGFRAKFKHDGEYDAHDAEFRQQVQSRYDIYDKDGEWVDGDENDMHDDGYSRANDPDAYSGANSEIFSSADLAGFHEQSTQLKPGDNLSYEFTAHQQIVDLSDNGKVIVEEGPRKETIWGIHPRKYTIQGDEL